MVGLRVFVVEDDPVVLSQLVKLITSAIPGLAVDAVSSVDEAQNEIESALRSGRAYDLAILDFHLPKKFGETGDVDESICRRLMASMPQTVVGHITAFLSDPRIAAHNERVHPPGRKQGFFLGKQSTGFAMELVTKSREALYGSHIEREIGHLLSSGCDPRASGGGGQAAAPWKAGNVSSRIVDLCLNISSTWTDLSPATKAHIQEFFIVDESPTGGVSVVRR
jgi:CheY-like chemotaxis protein